MKEVRRIAIGELKPFAMEIFSPYEGTRIVEMTESVRAYGVISPIIVREISEGYEILSGHNRVNAAEFAGYEEIPAINVGEISDEEAAFIVTESNVMQRGFMELSISERAKCVRVRHEAMLAEKIRVDLVKAVETMLKDEDSEVIGIAKADSYEFELSEASIKRYVRIDQLIDGLKVHVDSGVIKMMAGVNLSYLREDHQEVVADVMGETGYDMNKAQAIKLRELEKAGQFSRDKVVLVLFRDEVAQPVQYKVSRDIMSKYLNDYSSEEAMKIIEQALEMWFGGNSVAG